MKTSWQQNFAGSDNYYPAQGLIRAVRGKYPTKSRINVVGKKILDIGCGDGRNAEFLRSEGAEVFGVETTLELTKLAAEKFPECSFHVGSNKQLPFPDDLFDMVVSWNSCYYLENADDMFNLHTAEIRRVLKNRESLILFSIPQSSNFIYVGSKTVIPLPNYEVVEIAQDPFGIRIGQLMARFSTVEKIRKQLALSGIDVLSYGVESGDWFGLQYDWWVVLCSLSD